jgi:non-specific serine/threonine protein kinase/serine/threonine-protein kinase
VILYELPTEALPFKSRRLREAGHDGIPRILRDEDPPLPGLRASRQSAETSAASARARGADPAMLKRQLTGDLDWITMKALEKDRARRFRSAAELAADIRRHLCDEPVLAGPPTARYRTGEFVRRHRLAVIAASVVTVALAVGLLGTTAGLIRARRAEAAARAEAERADRVAGFLVNVLSSVGPDRMGKLMVEDLKQRAATAIRQRGASKEEISSSIALLDDGYDSRSDAEAALHDLLELARMTDYHDAAVLQVLALGYRATGNVSDAAETQRKAVALVLGFERLLRAEFESRLRRYEEARRAEVGEKPPAGRS